MVYLVSIFVVLIALFIVWLLLIPLFNKIGNVVSNISDKFKDEKGGKKDE
jgi:hypothetical protein